MGQVAEDMSDGTVCCICGQFFEGKDGEVHTHGYPVVCWDCWRDLDKKERKSYQRAKVKTFG